MMIILALLLIVLAFLISVKQRIGPKMRPHRARSIAQPFTDYHAYTGSISNAYNGTSVFQTRGGGPLYKHHSHDSSVALAILLLKISSKMKLNILQ